MVGDGRGTRHTFHFSCPAFTEWSEFDLRSDPASRPVPCDEKALLSMYTLTTDENGRSFLDPKSKSRRCYCGMQNLHHIAKMGVRMRAMYRFVYKLVLTMIGSADLCWHKCARGGKLAIVMSSYTQPIFLLKMTTTFSTDSRNLKGAPRWSLIITRTYLMPRFNIFQRKSKLENEERPASKQHVDVKEVDFSENDKSAGRNVQLQITTFLPQAKHVNSLHTQREFLLGKNSTYYTQHLPPKFAEMIKWNDPLNQVW